MKLPVGRQASLYEYMNNILQCRFLSRYSRLLRVIHIGLRKHMAWFCYNVVIMQIQIPPLKKSTFYIIIAAVVLVGIIIGLLISSYALLKNKVAFCQALAAPKNVSLAQGQTISGTVVSMSAGNIVMSVNAYDSFNPQVTTTVEVNMPIGPDDRLARFARVKNSSVLQPAGSVSVSEIKTGDLLTMEGLAGGAKIIYLPTINKL